MEGSTRVAAAGGREVFRAALTEGDKGELARGLFAVANLLDGNPAVRRALTDLSREGQERSALAERLLTGRTDAGAVRVTAALAAQRFPHEQGLVDAIEKYGVEAIVASAEDRGEADLTEEQLFRFERVVAADHDLRSALTDERAPLEARVRLVESLLSGKANAETVALTTQAVAAPRGRRFESVIERYLEIAAQRREQLTALVTSAIPLDERQAERLRSALASTYGKGVRLNTVVDPRVLGGIRIEIGGEVVDGTVLRKLDGARRAMGA